MYLLARTVSSTVALMRTTSHEKRRAYLRSWEIMGDHVEIMGDHGRAWGDHGRIWRLCETMGDYGRLWESMEIVGDHGRSWEMREARRGVHDLDERVACRVRRDDVVLRERDLAVDRDRALRHQSGEVADAE